MLRTNWTGWSALAQTESICRPERQKYFTDEIIQKSASKKIVTTITPKLSQKDKHLATLSKDSSNSFNSTVRFVEIPP
jgi:hypothetical protein